MTDKELDDLEARLRKLRYADNPVDYRKWVEDWANDSTDAADAIAELRKKIAGLVGALKPFADFAEAKDAFLHWGGYSLKGNGFDVKIEAEEFDAARQALKENTQ